MVGGLYPAALPHMVLWTTWTFLDVDGGRCTLPGCRLVDRVWLSAAAAGPPQQRSLTAPPTTDGRFGADSSFEPHAPTLACTVLLLLNSGWTDNSRPLPFLPLRPHPAPYCLCWWTATYGGSSSAPTSYGGGGYAPYLGAVGSDTWVGLTSPPHPLAQLPLPTRWVVTVWFALRTPVGWRFALPCPPLPTFMGWVAPPSIPQHTPPTDYMLWLNVSY